MLVERAEYWVADESAQALRTALEQLCELRTQLGLPNGTLSTCRGSDAPALSWHCGFGSESARAADVAARASDGEYADLIAQIESLATRTRSVVDTHAPIESSSQTRFDRTAKFERGVALRKAVLGDGHVDRSLAAAEADPFMLPIQQLTTEFGWGTVWDRPGLERKTRSFLSCAFLLALGKHEEFKTHVRGALNNGATEQELIELIIQAGLYCGFPVALEGTRMAKSVLEDIQNQA
ncbi:MAG: carboxymuconolactone decarboxylase family protein [Pseudomonadota bacterium]